MNEKFKIAIGMNLQKGAFGGGNQFGKTLSNFLNSRGIDVTFDLADQDIDLILLTETRRWLSSCAFDGREVAKYLSRKPNTLVVLRINECAERKGQKIKFLNRFILQHAKWADHVVFISAWLQDLFLRQDPNLKRKSTVILNGADERIFNPIGYRRWEGKGPLRLVTHHWGAHWNKGFDIYLLLDKLIEGEFKNQILFTFIGNIPRQIRFKNTKIISPQNGEDLALRIKENHIYLTASQNEPAGMHHIEGALCGLPLLYRKSGALPEYCKGHGISFNNASDFLQSLTRMTKEYDTWAQRMQYYNNTAQRMNENYYDLFKDLLARKEDTINKRNLTPSALYKYIILNKSFSKMMELSSTINNKIFTFIKTKNYQILRKRVSPKFPKNEVLAKRPLLYSRRHLRGIVRRLKLKWRLQSKRFIADLQNGKVEFKLDICGGKSPYENAYLNVDIQRFPGIDIVADIRKKISLPDNCVTEIFSCGTLEHFTLDELKKILKEFYRILKPQGKLVIGVPSLKKICDAYISNRVNFETLNQYLYGAQKNKYDFHKNTFDFDNMKSYLEEVDFSDIEEKNYDLPFHIPKYMMKIVCRKSSPRKSIDADDGLMPPSAPLDSKHLTGSAKTVSPVRNKFLDGVREQGSLTGFTGERVIEGNTPKRVWLDHVARYKFAKRYVKGKLVLDIACGTGYGAYVLKESGAKKIVGMDISKEAIQFARTKYKTKGLKFKLGNILNICFPKNHFDIITCFETIEHIKNPKKALRELERVLKPKSLLIISSPNRKLASPGTSTNNHPKNPFHTREYSTREFISILRNYFEVLEVYGQRGRNKLLFLPFAERSLKKILPMLYASRRGSPKLKKISPYSEHRYITIVCRKK